MSSINAAKLATGMLVITALALGLLLILLFATGRPVEHTAVSRIIVVVAVCLLVASLMLRPAAKVKLTVFLVSTWIALFALELFLSFTDGPFNRTSQRWPPPPKGKIPPLTPDPISKFSWIYVTPV